MASFSTLIIDFATVGQDRESIPERALDILLVTEDDEATEEIVGRFGLDPCTGRIICIGVY